MFLTSGILAFITKQMDLARQLMASLNSTYTVIKNQMNQENTLSNINN